MAVWVNPFCGPAGRTSAFNYTRSNAIRCSEIIAGTIAFALERSEPRLRRESVWSALGRHTSAPEPQGPQAHSAAAGAGAKAVDP